MNALALLGIDGLLASKNDEFQLQVLITRLEADELVGWFSVNQRVHIGKAHNRWRLQFSIDH
jgi:hypothetical protein